jgi:inorganic triphosphatase YgiF
MEIELKLALDTRHAARLKRHPLLAEAKPRRRHLHSVYFDTPEFDLMRRCIAFRLRRVGYHWVQTLKAESRAVGALSSRPEWEMAVAGSEPDFAVLPDEALARLADIDLARLAPVFVTDFRRATWDLEIGESVVELALDSGEIQAGDGRMPISEVEVELKSGHAQDLFDLADILLQAVPLRVEPRSKAERGYLLCEAVVPEPVRVVRPSIFPARPAGEAWAAVGAAALAQVVANVPGFLEHPEDIEYLHQLRIALRRLRGFIGLGRSLDIARPAWSQTLGEVMRGLNAARDWDVFQHETLPSVEDALSGSPLGEEFLDSLRRSARRARHEAQERVASPVFTRLVLDIGARLQDIPPTPSETAPWATDLLDERWKKLRKLCRKPSELGPGGRHEARIAAKKLRYAADALAGLYGKRGKDFIKRLAELQDCLGRANDAYIATRLLEDLRGSSLAFAYDAGRISGVMSERIAHHGNLSDVVWRRMARARPFWR